ncbi:hypothetical protein [Candidatus Protochlamydia phocaeensis]|nr:hypothetical protein [Candidatus Protochlamydia phocaeensis]
MNKPTTTKEEEILLFNFSSSSTPVEMLIKKAFALYLSPAQNDVDRRPM